VLTDAVHNVLNGIDERSLMAEVDSRWGLLEAAFQMKKGDAVLINDIRRIYLSPGYERRSITGTIPV
jgi:hypothetical protein